MMTIRLSPEWKTERLFRIQHALLSRSVRFWVRGSHTSFKTQYPLKEKASRADNLGRFFLFVIISFFSCFALDNYKNVLVFLFHFVLFTRQALQFLRIVIQVMKRCRDPFYFLSVERFFGLKSLQLTVITVLRGEIMAIEKKHPNQKRHRRYDILISNDRYESFHVYKLD